MILKIYPSKFRGFINSFSSKSFAIRVIFGAVFAQGLTIIENVDICTDVRAAVGAAKKLGAKVYFKNKILKIYGTAFKSVKNKNIFIDCFESGLVLRILSFIACIVPFRIYLKAGIQLLNRPFICDIFFDGKKFEYIYMFKNFLVSKKRLSAGKFKIDASVSSQFLTGLFFSLPILDGDSEIFIKNKMVSENYINMTIDVLKKFGISIKKTFSGFKIPGRQKYTSCRYFVEGDYSLAAFFNILGVFYPIKIGPLNKNSVQGERKILDILKYSGAKVVWEKNNVEVSPKSKLRSFNVNLQHILDLAPVLAVFACFCEGYTKLYGIKRLSIKESNRIKSTVNLLNSIGANAYYFKNEDFIKIIGGKRFCGGFVNGYKDHRIVMAAAVASSFSNGPIIISDCESVFKSYSSFFKDFNFLGGRFNVVSLE